MRKILHCDMDAFYASIEQRDNPDLRGRPVAVGGGGTRGVVAAASYEARAFGVRSAMPGRTAERLCPDLVFVRSRMDVYRDTGLAIRAVFARYTPMIEPLSLDEAYLDVTEHAAATGMTGMEIAKDIKAAILREFALTVSAGVSNCKFAAKIASGWQKPDGLTVIPPERVRDFIATLPIGRFHGVGPATAPACTSSRRESTSARLSRTASARALAPSRPSPPTLPNRRRWRRRSVRSSKACDRVSPAPATRHG